MPDGLLRLTTIPTFFGEDPVSSVTRRFGISIGQNIYTPQDTDTSAPIHNDRPYAAWLYASFALQSTYKRVDPRTLKDVPVRLDTLALDVGLVGPAAGGEFVQNNFHKLIGDATANGWANQLHNEPTIDLTFERRWRTNHGVVFEDPKLEYDVIPRIGATVGNVVTYASAGGTVRIGKDLQDDFGPTRARPALPGSEGFIGEGFGWYFFLGAGGEAVARNMFLDGNTRWEQHRPRHASAVRRRGAGRHHRPLPWRAHQLHAGAAEPRVLRARSLGPVRLDQRHVQILGAQRAQTKTAGRWARGRCRYIRPASSKTITMIRIRPAPPLG